MEAHAASSPLVAARLRRRLTLEEAAALTNLEVDDIKSLEESRTYRFPLTADAIAATVVYASALGITEREARELAGMPVIAVFLVFVLRPQLFPAGPTSARSVPPAPQATAAAPLPERWEIQVDVYNGTRQGSAASSLANEIAGMAYGIGEVRNADRRNYAETRVYYPPGAEAIAQRLAAELGVETTALPGGDDQSRLVVIVGQTR
jgi:LytR cell envelope-related transcriptional attenuator/Helix-turn-helix domain